MKRPQITLEQTKVDVHGTHSSTPRTITRRWRIAPTGRSQVLNQPKNYLKKIKFELLEIETRQREKNILCV